MKYQKNITLKDGTALLLRNGTAADAQQALDNFTQTHGETDYLLSYPDEVTFTVETEENYLKEREENEREVEILALVNGKIVGSAGVESLGSQSKLRHRAEFGISILKAYWGMGIGRELIQACIACAKQAGYRQLELTAVSDNDRAIALYTSVGFREFGRNPRGFLSRTGYQELIYMLLDLEKAHVQQ